jgi:hypothetical protein
MPSKFTRTTGGRWGWPGRRHRPCSSHGSRCRRPGSSRYLRGRPRCCPGDDQPGQTCSFRPRAWSPLRRSRQRSCTSSTRSPGTRPEHRDRRSSCRGSRCWHRRRRLRSRCTKARGWWSYPQRAPCCRFWARNRGTSSTHRGPLSTIQRSRCCCKRSEWQFRRRRSE